MVTQNKINYSRWRVISLLVIYLLMGIHIAHWKISGNTLAPLEFNEVLYTLHLGIITAGFIFMAVTMVATLVAGRFFCSWMCHILALQDASEWILKKMHIKPYPVRSRTLLWIPFIVMAYLFIWPQIERIYLDLPPVQFQLMNEEQGWASFMTNNFWRNLPGAGITLFTFFVCGFLIIYFLGSRSFCQHACPYGALFFMADKIAPGKIKLTGDCNQCGICTSVCSSHIQVHKEIKHFGKVVDGNCLKDMDCVQACPNDAIKFGFTRPSFLQSLNNIPGEKKRHGTTMKEDISLLVLFIVLLPAYRGLYDSIPFLLAVALAIILAVLFVFGIRLLTTEYVHLNKLVLKKSDKITFNGRFFILLLTGATVISIHSGFIQYHQLLGDYNYNKVVAMNTKGSSGLSHGNISVNLKSANEHLAKVYEFGLYTPASLNRQLASIYLSSQRPEEARYHLQQLIEKLPDDIEAINRYAKLLISDNDYEGARKQLLAAAAIPAETKKDKMLKSEALITLGHLLEQQDRLQDAMGFFQQAEILNPDNHEALLSIGILYMRAGQLDAAEKKLLLAAKFFTKNVIIENNLAVIYLTTKNYAKAIERLNILLEIAPDNVEVKYNLIMAQFSLGYRYEALNEMKSFAGKYPGHENATKAISMIEDNIKKSSHK